MLRETFDRAQPHQCLYYGRMSSDQQNPCSPNQQFTNIDEEICRQRLPWIKIKSYRDDAISGRLTRKRLGLQRMIADLKTGRVKASLVLVDTFERFSRAEESADLRAKLKRLGVLLLTADTHFADPLTPQGKVLSWMESMRSAEEGRVKGHNVLRGKKFALREKFWPGGPTPFGYHLKVAAVENRRGREVQHKRLFPDPATAWILQLVFELADMRGWGSNLIAKHLNHHPDIPDELKPFHASTIGSILDNEIYIGIYHWGKHCTGILDDIRVLQKNPESEWVRIPEFCEALIAPDRFQRVQALRSKRREHRQNAKSSESQPGLELAKSYALPLKYLLTGLVRCVHCGRAMSPSSSKPYVTKSGEQRRYVTYGCPAYSGGVCPNKCRVPEEWLRKTVVELIRQRVFNDD